MQWSGSQLYPVSDYIYVGVNCQSLPASSISTAVVLSHQLGTPERYWLGTQLMCRLAWWVLMPWWKITTTVHVKIPGFLLYQELSFNPFTDLILTITESTDGLALLAETELTEAYTCFLQSSKLTGNGLEYVLWPDGFIIPPTSMKLKGGYTGFMSSVHLSVRLSVDKTVSALYLPQY